MRVALAVLFLATGLSSAGCNGQEMVDDAQRESQYGPPRNVSRSLLSNDPSDPYGSGNFRPGE
jgi:hypothetical protein